jgi:competence protein ComEA
MIDDPKLPRPPRRRRGEPDRLRLSPTPPSLVPPRAPDVPPAAPPPIDEWDLGGTEVGWAAVAPVPFADLDLVSVGGVVESADEADAPDARPADARPAGARPTDARPAIVRLLRPWFEPRPGELRGAIVLLAVALAVSLALWFDAARRPTMVEPTVVSSVPAAVDGATTAPVGGRADGSDGWGIGAEVRAGPVVHVSGAVMRPGVVTVAQGARVADAIEAAGGAMPDARLDRLNLARVVEDAERIHVPRVGEDAPPPDEPASRGVLADGRIDLNLATQVELETLPGVGPARAQAIIAERESRPFRVPGDLRRVSGIGEATFQRLAPLVAVR